MKTLQLPKSLHTVTVLVNVARLYQSFGNALDASLEAALQALGYAGAADTYELAAKARAVLAKGGA